MYAINKKIILAFVFSLLLGSCAPKRGVVSEVTDGFSTPEKAFYTLLNSIRNQDIELYKKCWESQDALESEGEFDIYEKNPEGFWNMLNSIFLGEVTFEITSISEDFARCKSTSSDPKAYGGIGTITFQKINEEWKVHTW